MPSAWLEPYTTRDGSKRWRCRYRLGGRESPRLYAGSFPTKREGLARKAWVAGELAAMRVPDLGALVIEAPVAPTVAQVAARFVESRVDWSENTRIAGLNHIRRALPLLGSRPADQVKRADVAELVAHLAETGRKRATIKKTIVTLAQAFDHAELVPNPFRDKMVKLPADDGDEINTPTAGHVHDALRSIAVRYWLAVLVLDATGMRVGELEGLEWRDVDEPRERWKVRPELNHNRRARWVTPTAWGAPPELLDAVLELVPREDRDPTARVFPHVTQERLRTELARACRAAGVPPFTPHGLRHRRISLWGRQGVPPKDVGDRVGQRQVSTTLDRYTHVMIDDAELDYGALLARVRDARLRTPGAPTGAPTER